MGVLSALWACRDNPASPRLSPRGSSKAQSVRIGEQEFLSTGLLKIETIHHVRLKSLPLSMCKSQLSAKLQ